MNPLIQQSPLIQKSQGIVGDGKSIIFWKSNETSEHPITYFIVQYYEIVGDARVIHSKLVPKKKQKEHSVSIEGLQNNVQYLFQVVGVNKNGLGPVEKGNILLPENDAILVG
jgi:hypothetical protein